MSLPESIVPALIDSKACRFVLYCVVHVYHIEEAVFEINFFIFPTYFQIVSKYAFADAKLGEARTGGLQHGDEPVWFGDLGRMCLNNQNNSNKKPPKQQRTRTGMGNCPM